MIIPQLDYYYAEKKNRVTVDWSLQSANVPIGVSTYKLNNRLPKNILDKLPTEEEINLHIDMESGDEMNNNSQIQWYPGHMAKARREMKEN